MNLPARLRWLWLTLAVVLIDRASKAWFETQTTEGWLVSGQRVQQPFAGDIPDVDNPVTIAGGQLPASKPPRPNRSRLACAALIALP